MASTSHGNAGASTATTKRNRTHLSCGECRRLKLKCDRTWPCASCRKRGCGELCPNGTLKPLGRVTKAQLESAAWSKRAEELETILRAVGLEARIPPPLDLSKKIPLYDSVGDVPGEVELLASGVGSLTIREETGTTKFLGTSAGAAYFDNDTESYSSSEDEPGGISGLDTPPAVVVESVFWEDYLKSAYTVGGNGPKLACVLTILSLGSLFDHDAPSTYNATANQLFLLAQSALSASRFLSHHTNAAVQALQLASGFLFNTHRLHDGAETYFALLGVALKSCFTMGLHREGSHWGMSGSELNQRRLIFYELMSLERFQAFVSGRPYMIADNQFDTEIPTNAPPYFVWKWKLAVFLVRNSLLPMYLARAFPDGAPTFQGRVIDEAFSVKVPTYATIQSLDQELRGMFKASTTRSGTLPAEAFGIQPSGAPILPKRPPSTATLKDQMRNFTLDNLFCQIFLYLHKPAFAQALLHYAEEPLESPFAPSVVCVSLESGVYILALAADWIKLDPIVCPRWWHIFFHAFAVCVAQSSLVIASPKSMLSQHAWGELNKAVDIFEKASIDGAPVVQMMGRVQALRDSAFTALQMVMAVPTSINEARYQPNEGNTPGVSLEDNISVLGPSTRLSRKPVRKGRGDVAPSEANEVTDAPSTSTFGLRRDSYNQTATASPLISPALHSNATYYPNTSPLSLGHPSLYQPEFPADQTQFATPLAPPPSAPPPGFHFPTLDNHPSGSTRPSYDTRESFAQYPPRSEAPSHRSAHLMRQENPEVQQWAGVRPPYSTQQDDPNMPPFHPYLPIPPSSAKWGADGNPLNPLNPQEPTQSPRLPEGNWGNWPDNFGLPRR